MVELTVWCQSCQTFNTMHHISLHSRRCCFGKAQQWRNIKRDGLNLSSATVQCSAAPAKDHQHRTTTAVCFQEKGLISSQLHQSAAGAGLQQAVSRRCERQRGERTAGAEEHKEVRFEWNSSHCCWPCGDPCSQGSWPVCPDTFQQIYSDFNNSDFTNEAHFHHVGWDSNTSKCSYLEL